LTTSYDFEISQREYCGSGPDTPSGFFSYKEVPGDCQWFSTPPDIPMGNECEHYSSADKDCSTR